VTRRTLILTSLNNLFALLLFTLLVPLTQSTHINSVMAGIFYRLIGSVILGGIILSITLYVAHVMGKQKTNQFVLLVGSVMFAIGLSIVLKLPSMLTLFIFGIAARNLNYKHLLMEINFRWLANIFSILLFVITGIHLQIKGIWQATLIIFALLLVRTLAKYLGIFAFAKTSQLTTKQAWSLCFALTPMAGLAVGMSNTILNFNPNLSYELTTVIATAIALLNILGPIAVQLAFIQSGEVAQRQLEG
jgi:Kef-type K+ transport system membrane component KefB